MYSLLDWDSKLLGLRTARIDSANLDQQQLTRVLQELHSQAIQLVYWQVAADDHISNEAAVSAVGQLVDYKRTYAALVSDLDLDASDLSEVESYPVGEADPLLLQMAFDIATESRFGLDPKLSLEQQNAIYAEWMHNSCRRKVADEVLVIKRDNQAAAVVTLKEVDGRSDISLLAVHQDYRGQGLGHKVVRAGQAYAKQQGYEQCQVVTQQTNQAACGLYEACGYQLEKLDHFYHFWL